MNVMYLMPNQPAPQTKRKPLLLRPRASPCSLPLLCTRILVRAMIGLLKEPLFHWLIRLKGHSKRTSGNSVGCLWHSHGKNPVRLYPTLQSQPIGLPKIFIDQLFFQPTNQIVHNLYRFLIDLLEIRTFLAKFVALEFSHSFFRMAC